MPLSRENREDFLRLASSDSFRKEMRQIALNRHHPYMMNGAVDIDRLIAFLTEYNEFINHEPKPFKKMIEREMKL